MYKLKLCLLVKKKLSYQEEESEKRYFRGLKLKYTPFYVTQWRKIKSDEWIKKPDNTLLMMKMDCFLRNSEVGGSGHGNLSTCDAAKSIWTLLNEGVQSYLLTNTPQHQELKMRICTCIFFPLDKLTQMTQDLNTKTFHSIIGSVCRLFWYKMGSARALESPQNKQNSTPTPFL